MPGRASADGVAPEHRPLAQALGSNPGLHLAWCWLSLSLPLQPWLPSPGRAPPRCCPRTLRARVRVGGRGVARAELAKTDGS
eukprot:scaffold62413_cov33-Phaeocystis_antarctica.AAC.1